MKALRIAGWALLGLVAGFAAVAVLGLLVIPGAGQTMAGARCSFSSGLLPWAR